MEYTEKQKEVIETRNCNLIVSAAAGSGKTAVLTERILRRVVEDGVDVDRLLVVTFTRAAAAEMRERIAGALEKALAEHPEDTRLQRQTVLLHHAQITTIDSFCSYLLHNHFEAIDLNPAFRVADEGEIRLLSQEILEEVLEEAYAEKDPAFLDMADSYGKNTRSDTIGEYILQLCRFAGSHPYPEAWLRQALDGEEKLPAKKPVEKRKKDGNGTEDAERKTEGAEKGIFNSKWFRFLLDHAERMLQNAADEIKQAISLAKEPDGPYMYLELLEQEVEQLEKINKDYINYQTVLSTVFLERLPSKKDETVNVDKREAAKALRNEAKAKLKKLRETYFSMSPEALTAVEALAKRHTEVFTKLSLRFMERLGEAKKERNIIDFNDMEHMALRLLLHEDGTPTQIALNYRSYFEEILIDEYQDSNLMQEYILRSISRTAEDTANDKEKITDDTYLKMEGTGFPNRFVVGDVKQSIYRFRMARPELFNEKLTLFHRIDLDQNFRSRKQILDFVNFCFFQLMGEEIGGVKYEERVSLKLGASYSLENNEDYQTELLLISEGEEDKPAAEGDAEIFCIGERIRRLVGTLEVFDKEAGVMRKARYGDIAILLRSPKGVGERWQRALNDMGIPAHVASRTGYFSAPEVQTLLQLLRILRNPMDDISLFGVLRSVFGDFTDEEIARIRIAARDWRRNEASSLAEGHSIQENIHLAENSSTPESDPLAESLSTQEDASHVRNGRRYLLYEDIVLLHSEGHTDSLHADLFKKLARFLTFYEAYRRKSRHLSVRELLRELIYDSGYLWHVSAMPAGERRRANVEALLTKAAAFEKTSYHGLHQFVRYMDRLEKYEIDFGEAGVDDEHADVVRIMSVHNSKGLEFPICFLAKLEKSFNKADTQSGLVMDMDLGIAADAVLAKERLRIRSLKKRAIAKKLEIDEMGEELRIFYVAMTRAREKLICTATIGDAAKLAEQVGQVCENESMRLSYAAVLQAKSCLDWLLAALVRHASADRLFMLAGRERTRKTPLYDMPLNVDIQVIGRETLACAEGKGMLSLKEKEALFRSPKPPEGEANRALLQSLKENQSFSYPYEALKKLYTKTTVSELKMKAMEAFAEAQGETEAFRAFASAAEETAGEGIQPAFLRGEAKTGGVSRGSAFHKALERLPLRPSGGEARNNSKDEKTEKETVEETTKGTVAGTITETDKGTAVESAQGTAKEIAEQTLVEAAVERTYPEDGSAEEIYSAASLRTELARLRAAGRLSEETIALLDVDKLLRFYASPLARRMRRAEEAGRLFREQPFVIGIPANRLDKTLPAEEIVLVQGIIDVYFEEADGLVVMDYKTDRVSSGQELIDRYRTQLEYYAEALTQTTGLPVKERLLYSFSLNMTVNIDSDGFKQGNI